ncbi:hypothetical protein JWG39_14670 [Desulforhopalus vacuolatus]|uniref:hypothetical protein n=1 Tax=Desulforhopalus vacuolatus TaxID=40414 RepID=UPI001965E12D|nr:hypothetical protein [Desulforhopalus vacuolatus]MBM9521062.1 hypothetical protein [Desulforhopalus vacuolatus]
MMKKKSDKVQAAQLGTDVLISPEEHCYHLPCQLEQPVYLERDIAETLDGYARQKGVDWSILVNCLLREKLAEKHFGSTHTMWSSFS